MTATGGPDRGRIVPGARAAVLLGLLVLVGFVVRVDVLRNIAPPVPALGDAHAYHVLALNLADGRGYIRPYDWEREGRVVPTAEYPPALPATLAVSAKLGVRGTEGQRLVLAGIGAITVGLVGLAARRLGGDGAGYLGAAIAALHPGLVNNDVSLMAEPLAACAGAALVLAALAALDRPVSRRWLLLGAVAGLGCLVRSEFLLAGPVLIALIAWRVGRRARTAAPTGSTRVDPVGPGAAGGDVATDGEVVTDGGLVAHGGVVTDGGVVADRSTIATWRSRLAPVALGLGALVAVLAPWTVRNLTTFHAVVPLSNNSGSVSKGANCRAAYHGPYRGLWVTDVRLDGVGNPALAGCFSGFAIDGDTNEADAAAQLRADGLSYARHHLGELPGVMAARVGRTVGLYRLDQQVNFARAEGRSPRWERRGLRASQALAVLAVAALVLALVRRRHRFERLVVAVPIAAMLVTVALTYGNPRFRVAAEPSVVALAAVAVVDLRRLRTRRNPGW